MSLEKLIIDHAFWSDEVRRLKLEGEKASEACAKYRPAGSVILSNKGPYSCIEEAWIGYRDQDKSINPFTGASYFQNYDEIFENSEPCANCRDVRRLKAERMIARRRLGSIRGAITRVGRRLNSDAQQ